MTIRTILVALSGGSASEGTMDLAAHLAQRFEAHLEGFHTRPDARQMAFAVADGFGTPYLGDLIDRAVEEIGAAAARAKQHFDRAVAAHHLPLQAQPPSAAPGVTPQPMASASWREETGMASELVAQRARLFDLVVLGRSDRVVDKPYTTVLEEVLLNGARPLLLAPQTMPASLGEYVAIAWNGSAEAARAIAGAMPFLLRARVVDVLTVADPKNVSGDGLVEALRWHGISAKARLVAPVPGVGAGKQALAAARDVGADLLVMGGYGKAPWRETLLGGATREVIGTSLLPILIAH